MARAAMPVFVIASGRGGACAIEPSPPRFERLTDHSTRRRCVDEVRSVLRGIGPSVAELHGDGSPNAVGGRSVLAQDAHRDALALPNDPQHDVFGADMSAAQVDRLAKSELEDFLRARR